MFIKKYNTKNTAIQKAPTQNVAYKPTSICADYKTKTTLDEYCKKIKQHPICSVTNCCSTNQDNNKHTECHGIISVIFKMKKYDDNTIDFIIDNKQPSILGDCDYISINSNNISINSFYIVDNNKRIKDDNIKISDYNNFNNFKFSLTNEMYEMYTSMVIYISLNIHNSVHVGNGMIQKSKLIYKR